MEKIGSLKDTDALPNRDKMKFNYCFGTDIGMKRKKNQDNGAAYPESGLYLVADGMGGHQGGEIASAMTVDIVSSHVKETLKDGNLPAQDVLIQSLEKANEAIYTKSIQEPALRGMGTTATCLLFTKSTLTIGQVGDSRCYYFRDNALWQITRDHSLVEEKVHAGLITREEAKTDQMKNVITRSVGFEEKVSVEIFEMEVQPDDRFLICSDGLTGMIDDNKIREILQDNLVKESNVENAVNSLIESANKSGGEDNVTVLVVELKE